MTTDPTQAQDGGQPRGLRPLAPEGFPAMSDDELGLRLMLASP